MKDWLIEKSVPALLNDRVLQPYGELTDFRIDSRERSLAGALRLKGECDLVRIHISSYDVFKNGEDVFVVFNSVTTSREWLTSLARQFLIGRRFKLSEGLSRFAPLFS